MSKMKIPEEEQIPCDAPESTITYDDKEARQILRLATEDQCCERLADHAHTYQLYHEAMLKLMEEVLSLFLQYDVIAYSRVIKDETSLHENGDRIWFFQRDDEDTDHIMSVKACGDCFEGHRWLGRHGSVDSAKTRVRGPRLIYDRADGLLYGVDGRSGLAVVAAWIAWTLIPRYDEDDVGQ